MFLFLLFYCLLPLPFPHHSSYNAYGDKWNFVPFLPSGGKIATFLIPTNTNYLEYQLLGCLFSAIVKSIEILLLKTFCLNVTSP